MKFRSVLFLFGCLFSVFAIAQTSLPDKAMGIPKVFLDEEESWNWSNIVENRNWGECSQNFWKVYIDRDGVNSHKSPNATSEVYKSGLEFMQPYFVAKIQNGYALLYDEKYEQTNLTISNKAKSIGWVSVDELLLWSTCPRTIGQVYQKAVIVKDVNEIQNQKDINEVSPEFSKSPSQVIGTGRRAVDLEFYFVYKIVNGAALLFEDNKLANSLTASKKGWIRQGFYTTWNERLCFEPNFGTKLKGNDVAIFESQQDARIYKSTGDVSKAEPIWADKLTEKRWAPKKVRFPVLSVDNNFIAQVGTISSFGSSSTLSSDVQQQIDNINEKIRKIENKLKRVNVVFVMDGTSSMKNYYQPMAKALKQAMAQNSMKGANMYFGAVVYRNYDDEKENRLVETKQLTTNYEEIANWLVSRECRSIGSSHYEALYYGLETAVNQMNWSSDNSNFLILVGDAGNISNDAKGKSLNQISQMMAKKGINFVAFQANHPDHIAYHDFAIQIQKMMIAEMSFYMGRNVKRTDFDLKNQLYSIKSRNGELPIISAGYRFAEINISESSNNLQNLVEQKIVDFKQQAEDNLAGLRTIIDGLGGEEKTGGEFTQNAIEFLKRRGLTDNDIKTLKERNTILKIKGAATRVAGDIEVFTPCVFMAKAELDQLIASLKTVSKNVTTNKRQDLYNALRTLALSYLGQNKSDDDLSVDAIMEAVSGLTKGIGQNPLSGVVLKDILYPNKVTDAQINDFMSQIASDVQLLEKRKTDKTCYFDSQNGLRYYYILFEDMPLQRH